MASFTDSKSKDWNVAISVEDVRQVRAVCGVNLYEAIDGNLFAKLAGDPVALVDVLYVVCKSQADSRGINAEEFGRALAGDSIEKASDALIEAIIDFFPKARREVLRQIAAKLATVQAKVATRAKAIIESPELDRAVDRALGLGE